MSIVQTDVISPVMVSTPACERVKHPTHPGPRVVQDLPFVTLVPSRRRGDLHQLRRARFPVGFPTEPGKGPDRLDRSRARRSIFTKAGLPDQW
ncbi:hypothetical protein RGQ15_07850 [Paracoccus sp. MBLB3053]|uniref:Uncharacterized protein n=1 Tax=Paracoccus aurantius TaxID=3073814 RepID=A0ABU2HR16_9RHOB|nr:hypothetical protein [Paracoccus sp. MBLB3053]MDS9467487.1 hypothetical protein [Paracoccus sp. MBLB3053]